MLFENNNVLHQLRCGGVLEAVRISCAGFPTKTPFPDFIDHFWNLVPELLSNEQLDDIALSKAVLKKANLQGYQCGLNKVACHPQDTLRWVQNHTAKNCCVAAPCPGLHYSTPFSHDLFFDITALSMASYATVLCVLAVPAAAAA